MGKSRTDLDVAVICKYYLEKFLTKVLGEFVPKGSYISVSTGEIDTETKKVFFSYEIINNPVENEETENDDDC